MLRFASIALPASVGVSLGIAAHAIAPAAGAPAARTAPAAVTVTSKLPAWVAPGVRVPVTGFAGSARRVDVRVDGRTVSHTLSGRLGRFLVSFAAPAPGRHAVSVSTAGGSRAALGVLQVRPVILAAVGDVTTGEQVGASMTTLGVAYPWTRVGAVLRAADLATANLEGAVSSRGTAVPAKEFHFRGAPALLRGASSVGGLDVVTVANNHSGDYGSAALLDTIRYAHAAGLETVGGGASAALAARPAILVVGGLRVAFVAFSDVNPLGFNATSTTPGTAKADPEAVAAAVSSARARADVVVCWFHWGVELHPDPSARQQELAAAALNAGAQVVLGAHPHVFGRVQSPRAHSVVAWTLGNFVFPAGSPSTETTGILTVNLDRHGVRGWRVVHATIHGFRPELDSPQPKSG
jgi:poly-gamma-glutamate synthesis protein (capsule biosynthesis protein)